MPSKSTSAKSSQPAAPAPVPAPVLDRVALEAKYHDKLAQMRERRARIQHITKHRNPLRAKTLYSWFTKGLLKIADWNRGEVEDREGTPEEWMESLAEKVSPGHFIAYWVGTLDKSGKFAPTPANPVIVYEGGHRTRWTQKIFSNEVLYYGMTYSELAVVDPETATAIEDSVIDMTISISPNAERLVEFAKHEYDRVNTRGANLRAGEIIRTGADVNRAALEATFKGALKRDLKSKKRDADLEDLRALVHGAAGLTDRMDKKSGSLTKVTPLTAAEIDKALTVIAAVATAESRIANLFEDKRVKNRVRSRQLVLPYDGTLVYALQAASNMAEQDSVVDDWVTYHQMFFADATVWGEKMKDLKRATVDRSRYGPGETAYPGRWARIQNSIRPIAPAALNEAELDVPAAEVV